MRNDQQVFANNEYVLSIFACQRLHEIIDDVSNRVVKPCQLFLILHEKWKVVFFERFSLFALIFSCIGVYIEKN